MGKRPEQTLHHGRSTVRKRSHEKMLHVVRHRENANQNDNETPLQTSPNGPKPDAGDTQRRRDGAAGMLGAAGATWRGQGAGRPGGLLRNSSYSDPVSQPAGSLELAPMKRALTSTQHPRADAAGSFLHDGQNPGATQMSRRGRQSLGLHPGGQAAEPESTHVPRGPPQCWGIRTSISLAGAPLGWDLAPPQGTPPVPLGGHRPLPGGAEAPEAARPRAPTPLTPAGRQDWGRAARDRSRRPRAPGHTHALPQESTQMGRTPSWLSFSHSTNTRRLTLGQPTPGRRPPWAEAAVRVSVKKPFPPCHREETM